MESPGFPRAGFHIVPGRGQPQLSCRRSAAVWVPDGIPGACTEGLSAAPACAPRRSCLPSAADRLPPERPPPACSRPLRGHFAGGLPPPEHRCRGRSRGDCSLPDQNCRCPARNRICRRSPWRGKRQSVRQFSTAARSARRTADSCSSTPVTRSWGCPLQQKKAQKSGACPQVAHPQPRPQPGQRGEEKRIRPRRKERIAVNKAVSSRAKGLPMLHQMHLLCVFPYYKENRPGLQAPRGHLWRSDLAGGGKRSIQDLARGKAQLV